MKYAPKHKNMILVPVVSKFWAIFFLCPLACHWGQQLLITVYNIIPIVWTTGKLSQPTERTFVFGRLHPQHGFYVVSASIIEGELGAQSAWLNCTYLAQWFEQVQYLEP